MPAAPGQRGAADLATVFRRYGPAYRAAHRLSRSQLRVMRAVEICRTDELGGHLERCAACGFEQTIYHSCRNRHCPQCQSLATARWLEARQAELLPVGYFHGVFTLSHTLNPLIQANPQVLYGQLFHSVNHCLQAFAKNELGGTLGFLATLHTWDQQLRSHVHLHCLVPAGALSFDQQRWLPTPAEDFLFRVEPLGIKFQGHFLAQLKTHRAAGRLVFPEAIAHLGTRQGFAQLVDELFSETWLPHTKPPFVGPDQVLDYLGRYVHRVAISNHRILAVEDGAVRFRYRDRSDGDKRKTTSLPADVFIGRFLSHVLPDRFLRIRHFGFLSNRTKKNTLARCRELLGVTSTGDDASPPTPESTREVLLALTGTDIHRCPTCDSGTLVRGAELKPRVFPRAGTPRTRAPPARSATP